MISNLCHLNYNQKQSHLADSSVDISEEKDEFGEDEGIDEGVMNVLLSKPTFALAHRKTYRLNKAKISTFEEVQQAQKTITEEKRQEII